MITRVIHLDEDEVVDRNIFLTGRVEFINLLSDVYRGEDFQEVIKDHRLILVGGQASALWYYHHLNSELKSKDLHFTYSDDVDFLGTGKSLEYFGDKLKVEIFKPDPFDPSVSLGLFTTPPTERFPDGILVDIIHSVSGLTNKEIESGIENLTFSDVDVPVINPVLCLKSRVSNFFAVFKADKVQEMHRVEINSRVASKYIDQKLTGSGWDKKTSGHIEKMFEIARSKEGCDLYINHNIDILHPLNFSNPSIHRSFADIRLPQAMAEVEDARIKRLLHQIRFNGLEPLKHCGGLMSKIDQKTIDMQISSRPSVIKINQLANTPGLVFESDIDFNEILSSRSSGVNKSDPDPEP